VCCARMGNGWSMLLRFVCTIYFFGIDGRGCDAFFSCRSGILDNAVARRTAGLMTGWGETHGEQYIRLSSRTNGAGVFSVLKIARCARVRIEGPLPSTVR